MPQRCDDPALRQQNARLDFRLISGLVRARGHDAYAIVHRHLLIRGVQVGIIAAGSCDARFGVIGNNERRHTAAKLKSVDVSLNPRFHLLIASRLGVRIGTGPQDSDEQGCLPDQTGGAFVDRNRWTGPIDEQLLARLVLLPEHDIELAPPLLIMVTEVAVTVTIGVRLPVFHPEELQRHVPVLPKLVVNRWEIRRCSMRWRRRRLMSCSEQLTLDPVVIPLFCQRPPETGSFCPPQVVVNRGLPDGAAPGDLTLPEPQLILQT
jgi:hypothetical protein